MKVSSLEKKFIYIAIHQVFTVALVVAIYAYDYALKINIDENEIVYLMLAFFSLLGSIASIVAFTVVESHIILKPQHQVQIYQDYLLPL